MVQLVKILPNEERRKTSLITEMQSMVDSYTVYSCMGRPHPTWDRCLFSTLPLFMLIFVHTPVKIFRRAYIEHASERTLLRDKG